MTDLASRPAGDAGTLWFLGSALKIVVSAKDGSDGLCVIEQWMAKGEATPLHVHRNQDEVFTVLGGRLRLVVGGRESRLGAGETALAPKGVPHAFVVESDEAHVLVITKGSDFETLVRALSRPAEGPGLPPHVAPTPEMIAALTETCRRNNIDIVGPPIG